MNKIFKFLPLDNVNLIMEYANTIKFRNGKYMYQLLKSDYRYNVLENVFCTTRFKLNYNNSLIRILGKYQLYYTRINFKDDDDDTHSIVFSKIRQPNDSSSISLCTYQIK